VLSGPLDDFLRPLDFLAEAMFDSCRREEECRLEESTAGLGASGDATFPIYYKLNESNGLGKVAGKEIPATSNI
jgi:hypothetical protein